MDILSGRCQCGCGMLTSIAPQSNTKWGWVRGRSIRFIRGHSSFRKVGSTKICGECGSQKPIGDFGKSKRISSGLRSCCKQCRKKEYKKEEKSKYNRRWYRDHRESVLAGVKKYAADKKDYLRKYKNQYDKNRAAADIVYRIKRTLRSRLRGAIRNGQKGGSAIAHLGCSIDQFKAYLEARFQEGMNWENYGNRSGCWTIDHIKPFSQFNLRTQEGCAGVCHYTNLQPLWHIDNVRKGNT